MILSGKYDLDITKKKNKENNIINIKENKKNKEKEEMIKFELSNGEKIKTKISYINKYPNSVLAAYLNKENNFPKRNGHIFIDREPINFKNLLYYLENNNFPIFNNPNEEKNFLMK